MGWLNDLGNTIKKTGATAGKAVIAEIKFHKPTNQWFQGVYCQKADWMAVVPDDVLLTEMWIPGTHDSGADHGGDFAQCQNQDLRGQLNIGMRFFDIRPQHINDELHIYHGIMDMHKQFKDVVNALEDFLDQHPSEVIFVFIKKNGQEGSHSQNFNDLVRSQFRTPDRWVGPGSFGKLGDVRGKIILTATSKGASIPLPNRQREVSSMQNKWDTGNYDVKRKAIRDFARSEREPNRLYISFISCTGKDGIKYHTPAMMAEPLNKTVYDEIGSYNPGIYIFDFPGSGLAERIIARNRTSDKRQVIKEQFRRLDLDGNGMLSRSELKRLLNRISSLTDGDIDQIYSQCDANNDGKLNYEEFVEWAFSPEKERLTADVAKRAPVAASRSLPAPAQESLVYGSFVSLKHIATGCFLHSHPHNYPAGSRQQQVTCFSGDDDNNAWLVKAAHGEWCTRGRSVGNGDVIRLQHVVTGKNLHSHGIPSPVTGQQEVCGFGDDGAGDGNDNWRVELEGDKFRLIHVLTNHALHSHRIALPAECFNQQEVTSNKGRDNNDFWCVDQIELPAVLVFGSKLSLQHAETDVYLHSHNHNYPSGSRQQQVTGFDGHDDNDSWLVQGPHGKDTEEGTAVEDGDVVRLLHAVSRHYLHSHKIPAMVTGSHHEVTGYAHGDENNNWRVEYEGDKLRLIHVNTNHALHSHHRNYPGECFNQQEITCYGGRDQNDLWVACDVMIN
eukprot:TRINITY_DN23782_c0_g1_i1.p1 TRINITY_DN23782_c0_g1~~TRINITY_DN23782_c0_g1_i1.p1  ORF type:complete len:726 (-),score=113.49 TRINITY_DN23782_c0_g1_i1:54-2231(-)